MLKDANVTESHVRIFLNQMSVGQKENIPLYEQRMAEIISHVTLEEIFLFCSRIEVWNFLNFQLLQDLADHFKVEQLKICLQGYSAAVDAFKRNTKLVDFLRIWAGRNSLKTLPDSEPVFAKLKAFKWEDYTLEDVARHEKYLASEFRLRQLVMRFSNAGEGCVVLMWLVTKSVAAKMKKIMSGKEKPHFDSLTIEELNIGGRIFKVLTTLLIQEWHFKFIPNTSYLCCRWRQTMTVSTNTASIGQKCFGLTEQRCFFSGSSHLTGWWSGTCRVEWSGLVVGR